MTEQRETALVVGVGPGLGAALARRFASAGMNVGVAARDVGKLAPLAEELSAGEAEARAYGCDVADAVSVEAFMAQAEDDLGPADLVAFNAGAFQRKTVLDTTPEEFEACWRIACMGGFLVGRAAARWMVERGGGTIVFTGATAALRGGANFVNLAVPKFGLRALSQSMARELGPQGVHVAHVIVDGLIHGEKWAQLAGEGPPDKLLDPAAIAANYLHLHRQPRSAWTQELDLRPWVEKF